MKTRFIFNPTSGRNRRRPGFVGELREFIRAHAIDAEVAVTEGPGHATEFARDAVLRGHEIVVAVGGDGTMNEVAQALLDTPAALALVPCGSGNGLALHLGLPRATYGALLLAAGRQRRIAAIDTGVVNGLPFFNVMGLGLDADISHRFNRLTRRGLPAYARTAIQAMRALRTERCEVRVGGLSETIDATLIAVANSDQYGNNARIAPGARVDDAALDLVAVRSVGLLDGVAIAARLFLGTLDASLAVSRIRAPRFVIQRAGPGLIHTDGETHATGQRLEIAVRPASLRIVVPEGSHAIGRGAPERELALSSS